MTAADPIDDSYAQQLKEYDRRMAEQNALYDKQLRDQQALYDKRLRDQEGSQLWVPLVIAGVFAVYLLYIQMKATRRYKAQITWLERISTRSFEQTNRMIQLLESIERRTQSESGQLSDETPPAA